METRATDTYWLRCFRQTSKKKIGEEFPVEEVPEMLAKGEKFWVDILNPTEKDNEWLAETFQFHELALTDLLNNKVRPKQELYGDVLFTVFGAINLNPGEDALDTINLNIFLTDKYVVSTHCKQLLTVRQLIGRIAKQKNLIGRGPDFIFYSLLDGVVNRYFDVLDTIEEEIQVIEDKIFREHSANVQEALFTVKKKIAFTKRSINPQRDALRTLVYEGFPQLDSETQTLLRDVLDHVLRISDTIESYRELVSGLMDSYMTQISNRMNEVMKLMSIIATVMLPLSFMTGLFGMNFENMPGLAFGPIGFWVLVGLMVAAAALILWAFKKYKII